MRVAYDAQLTASLFLSRRAKKVFHAGRAFHKTRPRGGETENGVSMEEGSAIGYEACT
jgi:hypothetical protein